MTKIIITGSKSQLSQTFKHIFNKKNKYFYFDKNEFNINNYDQVEDIISDIRPDYILNTAAVTNLEYCEKNKKEIIKTNSYAPLNLAKLSIKYNFVLIHISTDYVFEGKIKKYYDETDITNPVNIYGSSKQLAENLLKQYSDKVIIIRVSWLYSNFKNNILLNLINQIKNNDKIIAINNLYSVPTSCYNLSYFINFLIKNKIKKINNNQILHFRDSGKMLTPYLLIKFLDKELNIKNKNIEIIQSSLQDYQSSFNRPKYSSLAINKIKKEFNYIPNYWKNEIKYIINNI